MPLRDALSVSDALALPLALRLSDSLALDDPVHVAVALLLADADSDDVRLGVTEVLIEKDSVDDADLERDAVFVVELLTLPVLDSLALGEELSLSLEVVVALSLPLVDREREELREKEGEPDVLDDTLPDNDTELDLDTELDNEVELLGLKERLRLGVPDIDSE